MIFIIYKHIGLYWVISIELCLKTNASKDQRENDDFNIFIDWNY